MKRKKEKIKNVNKLKACFFPRRVTAKERFLEDGRTSGFASTRPANDRFRGCAKADFEQWSAGTRQGSRGGIKFGYGSSKRRPIAFILASGAPLK